LSWSDTQELPGVFGIAGARAELESLLFITNQTFGMRSYIQKLVIGPEEP